VGAINRWSWISTRICIALQLCEIINDAVRRRQRCLVFAIKYQAILWSEYEGCSMNNETVLIRFWFAFNCNKSKYYCKIKLISYLMSKFDRLMTNTIGTTSFSITIVTHYRPLSKLCANGMFSWLIKSNDYTNCQNKTYYKTITHIQKS